MGALTAVLLLAYANSFSSGFVLDNRVMLQDPRITAPTGENLRLIFTRDYWYSLTATGLYRPLSTLTYLLNNAIFGNGADPAGWHWINFLLHAANLALVYALGLILLGETVPAAALAGVWALHPVLTESVTNIVGRADLLSAFGVLAGLLCHIRAGTSSGRQRLAWLAGLMLAASIGISSKESAVVLPALMALYDFALRRERRLPVLAASYAMVALPFAIFFSARARVLAGLPPMRIVFTDNPLVAAGLWTGRLTAVKVIGKYLWLLAWPLDLSCDYSYNQVPVVAWPFHSWEDWKALVALAVCAAAVAAAVLAWRRRRLLAFFIAFFFVALAPTANLAILIGSLMAERFLYLPSLGFAGALVLTVWRRNRSCGGPPGLRPAPWPASSSSQSPAQRPDSSPAGPIIVLAAIALLFAIRTYARNADWHDDVSLWSSAVAVSPHSYKARVALASALANAPGARIDDSIREIEQAFAILEPLPDAENNPAPYIDGGTYYGQKGEMLSVRNPDGTLAATPAADSWYRKSLASLLRAKRIEAVNVAGERRRAEALGRPARPARWYELYLALGGVYLRLNRPRDALAELEQGLRIRPVPEFFEKISSAYLALGDPHSAALTLLEDSIMDPRQAQLRAPLAALYRQIDPRGCAVRDASLDMTCPLVHADVCAAAASLAALYREIGLDPAGALANARNFGCPAP